MLALEYRIKDLDSRDKDIDMSLLPAFVADALLGFEAKLDASQLALDVRLTKIKSTVLCDGWLRGRLMLSCQRCLEPAAIELSHRIHSIYVPETDAVIESSEGSDEDQDEDDLDYAHHNGEVVDLWPLLREQIILSIPMAVLCKEDCRGLCPSCGLDRNQASCSCQAAPTLSPFAALRNIKLPS
jgi:uncharacterized protein